MTSWTPTSYEEHQGPIRQGHENNPEGLQQGTEQTRDLPAQGSQGTYQKGKTSNPARHAKAGNRVQMEALMRCTWKELNAMDLGTHMHVMEEWNPEAGFVWGDAYVILHGYFTRVIQEDGKGGLHVATYVTNGEGDLRSLRVYTDTPQQLEEIAPSSEQWVKDDLTEMHQIGFDYWYTPEKLVP
jgi:hypothetical protein